MPISTTDVVTNVVSGVEVTNNGTVVVSCSETGEFDTINATLDTSISYTALEAKLTNRFDDIYYYNVTTSG